MGGQDIPIGFRVEWVSPCFTFTMHLIARVFSLSLYAYVVDIFVTIMHIPRKHRHDTNSYFSRGGK
jgi:hypothetical protein